MNRLALALSLILPVAAGAQTYPDATAIVSVGGPVTETVFALGQDGVAEPVFVVAVVFHPVVI